jgi:hypothetical protein
MKIDEQILFNVYKDQKGTNEKINEKSKSPSAPPKSDNLVRESNLEAYTLSLTMVESIGKKVQIHWPEEAEEMAQKLQGLVLQNPRDFQNSHSNLEANKVKTLLSDI